MLHIQDTFQRVGNNPSEQFADTIESPALRPALVRLDAKSLPAMLRGLLLSRGAVQLLPKQFRGMVEAVWLRNGQPVGPERRTEITGSNLTPIKRPPRAGSTLQLTFTAADGERFVAQLPTASLTFGAGSSGYRSLDEHAGAFGARLPAQQSAAPKLQALTYANVPHILQSFYLGRAALQVVPGSFRGNVTMQWRQDGAPVGAATQTELLGLSVEKLNKPAGSGDSLQLTFESTGGERFTALLNRGSLTFGVGSGGYRNLWDFAGARGGPA